MGPINYSVRYIEIDDSEFLEYLQETYAYDAFRYSDEFLCSVDLMSERHDEQIAWTGDLSNFESHEDQLRFTEYEQCITEWLDEAAQDGIEVYWFGMD